MKKATIAAIFAALLCCTAQAQEQPRIRLNVCPQSNENLGVRAGADFDIPINHRFSFTPGVYWSLRNRLSTSETTKNGITSYTDFKDRANFITIPLRIGIKLPLRNEDKFALELLEGPYIAYGTGGTSKATIRSEGKTTQSTTGAFDADGRYSSRLDYGWNVGINGTFHEHYTVGLFSEIGFKYLYNGNNAFEDIIGVIVFPIKINMAVGLTLGYRF